MNTYEETILLEQNVDYELVPSEGENWDVRLLTGDYTETVIKFSELTVSDDDEYLKFNFDVVSSPDLSLTDENTGLQEHASNVLSSILTYSVKALEEKESDDKR